MPRPPPRRAAGGDWFGLAGGLMFRFAWVYAGKTSAADHATVVALAREGAAEPSESVARAPMRVPGRRLWSETVRRVSLAVEGVVRAG